MEKLPVNKCRKVDVVTNVLLLFGNGGAAPISVICPIVCGFDTFCIGSQGEERIFCMEMSRT